MAAFVNCKNLYRAAESQIEMKYKKTSETKQVRSTKFSFDIFIEIVFAFLLHLLIGNFKPESYCSERNNWI